MQDPLMASHTHDRSTRGRESHRRGYSFEENVAELYKLIHYDVEHGRLFSGRQVDLFMTRRLGDLTIHRAIECKAGPVTTDHIDSFIIKLRLVRHEYPAALGSIISGSSFTDAVTSHAAREGIQLTFFRDLAAQLLDGHCYAQNLLRECRNNDQYPMKLFIEPKMGYNTTGESFPAFELIDEWLKDDQWQQLTLLGDVGTGKSFLARVVAHNLAVEFLKNSLENPLPVLIDLRNADRQFSLEGLILTHVAKCGLKDVSFDVFQYVLSQGQIVLIFDGFDEMAARITPQVTERNFQELARCVRGRAKVILTCRTHYFKSRTEEEEVVFGRTRNYGSEAAKDLYWELISRKGFSIAYLRPFEISEIEEYVRLARPTEAADALAKIQNTYNLMELSQRPMLLEMIVKSLDKLTVAEINAATLYQVFTDVWIHRDQWREVLSPEQKVNFLTGLARSLWDEDVPTIHHARLNEYVKAELLPQLGDMQQFIEIDSEIRTASFLTRDNTGHYGFAHKSYSEYFFARYLASQLDANNLSCLNTRRISSEVLGFLRDMVDFGPLEPALEGVLIRTYTAQLSENALICLYSTRRAKALTLQDVDSFVVLLPPRMDLSSAHLDQLDLTGAVMAEANFSKADLSEAILTRTALEGASLHEAKLYKSDLADARLDKGDFSHASLVGSNLKGASLLYTDFRSADLTDAFLSQVKHQNANFDHARMTNAFLPNELELLYRKTDRIILTSPDAYDADRSWTGILKLRPTITKAAKLVGLASGEDPEDIESELIIKLRTAQNLGQLLRQNRTKRKQHVFWLAKQIQQQRLATRRHAFNNFARPELRGDEDDESFAMNSEMTTEYSLLTRDKDESRLNERPELLEEPEEEALDDLFDPAETLIGNAGDPYERALIEEIRQTISPTSWNVVEAWLLHDDPIEDIANTQGVSVVSVQRQIRKAREILAARYFEHRAWTS